MESESEDIYLEENYEEINSNENSQIKADLFEEFAFQKNSKPEKKTIRTRSQNLDQQKIKEKQNQDKNESEEELEIQGKKVIKQKNKVTKTKSKKNIKKDNDEEAKKKKREKIDNDKVKQQELKYIYQILQDQESESKEITISSLRKALNAYKIKDVPDEDVLKMINVLNENMYGQDMEIENLNKTLDNEEFKKIYYQANYKI